MTKKTLTHLDEQGRARMVDVGAKEPSLRRAVAACEIQMEPETLRLMKGGELKKGDAFATAKIAAVLAVKKTPQIIPLCHPLPVEFIDVRFADLGIDVPRPDVAIVRVECEVRVTAKTGVEIEAMHGAMTAALTVYDMAKSYDPGMTIQNVRLVLKTGGKSDFSH